MVNSTPEWPCCVVTDPKPKLTTRISYGFWSEKLRRIALYHSLGNLLVPESPHRFI